MAKSTKSQFKDTKPKYKTKYPNYNLFLSNLYIVNKWITMTVYLSDRDAKRRGIL